MLAKDIRYAFRSLLRSKGFTTAAVLCLGFGIGLNATIFSIMDGVLLKPYPYADPDRLLVVSTKYVKNDGRSNLSYLDMQDWKKGSEVFTTIAATLGRSLAVADSGGEPDRYSGAGVSWDLFPLLGTAPILGHGFTEADDTPGGGGVVLLSHDLWTMRYRADREILGKSILINSKPHVVIGVMPPKFNFPQNQKLWVPLAPMAKGDGMLEPNGRRIRGLFAFGRLKPGVSQATAKQALDSVAAGLAKAYPATNADWSPDLRPLRDVFLPTEVPLVIYLMMAGATIVLFIACSNVANLLLARASARRREISLRTALGANRSGIIKQLLTEGVVLNLISVPLGLVLAVIGTRLIASAMPPDQVPYYVTWEVDWRSFLYTVMVAVGTALLFGLFPALQVSRGNLHDALKEGTRGNSASRSWLRSVLVIVQISLALVALVGALLFVRTFKNLDTAGVGFDPSPVMTMRFYMTGEPYDPPDARLRRVEDVMQRVERLPGVHAAFASNFVPLSGGGGGGPIVIEGQPVKAGEEPGANVISVTPGFTKTLGLLPIRGRDFTASEGYTRAAVALVNEAMAKRFWPKTEALGGRFKVLSFGNDEWFTVVGVIPDAKLYGVDINDDSPTQAAFVPYAYGQTLNTGLSINVDGPPSAVTAGVRAAIRASDPNLPMAQVRTMDEARRLAFWQYGLYSWIFGTIGIVSLLLASVGVYGVLAFAVTQRTQEIGVRVALGASRTNVLGLVVRQGMILAGIGALVGLGLAPMGTYFARGFFFKVSPFDPLTFAAVAAFLVAVAFLASYIPALRATRVDPLTALRGE